MTPLRFIYPNLVSQMRKHNLDYSDIASILGISKYAVYRRLRGFAGWKLQETIQLAHYFECSDVAWLFQFDDTITQKF
jgi:predicted transcriptional regulator